MFHLKLSRLQRSGASSRAAMMNDYELAGETSLQASRCTSKCTWRSAHKYARLFYQAHSICLHWMLWSTQRRGPHHDHESYQLQTSRTIVKVRKSTFKILNMNTRKARTNTQSTRTRRRPTHITKKHCDAKCAPMFDCSSTKVLCQQCKNYQHQAQIKTKVTNLSEYLVWPWIQ